MNGASLSSIAMAAVAGALFSWISIPELPRIADDALNRSLAAELDRLNEQVASWAPPVSDPAPPHHVASNDAGSLADESGATTIAPRLHSQPALSCESVRSCNTEGMELYHRGSYQAALERFQHALTFDSENVVATYNAACAYALLINAAQSVGMLRRLAGSSTEAATAKLRKVASDPDFDAIRSSPEFLTFAKELEGM